MIHLKGPNLHVLIFFFIGHMWSDCDVIETVAVSLGCLNEPVDDLFKATMCRKMSFFKTFRSQVRCNVGADYRQNIVLKLVCWNEHVCDAVIRPAHRNRWWRQKHIQPLRRHWTINTILKLKYEINKSEIMLLQVVYCCCTVDFLVKDSAECDFMCILEFLSCFSNWKQHESYVSVLCLEAE